MGQNVTADSGDDQRDHNADPEDGREAGEGIFHVVQRTGDFYRTDDATLAHDRPVVQPHMLATDRFRIVETATDEYFGQSIGVDGQGVRTQVRRSGDDAATLIQDLHVNTR